MNRDAGQILFQIKSILKSGQSDFMMIEEIISCLGQYGIQVDCHDFG